MDQERLLREQATLARSVANWKMATDRIAMFELSNIWLVAADKIERQNQAERRHYISGKLNPLKSAG